MYDILIQQMKDEVLRLGAVEIRTTADADATIQNSKGTLLVFINSTCGCAGGTARPALTKALQHPSLPDSVATVFASTDREATARIRQHIGEHIPASSPSFALFRDGKLTSMIHRYQIEGHSVDQVVRELTAAFDRAHTEHQRA